MNGSLGGPLLVGGLGLRAPWAPLKIVLSEAASNAGF